MKILLTNKQINKRIKELAQIISNDLFGQENIIVAPVLKGGMLFGAHLFPHLGFPCKLEYFHTSRYQDKQEGSELIFIHEPMCDLKDTTVVLIDDIYDEGITLDKLEEYCYEQGAKKVVSVVLLTKNKTNKNPKYVGFEIPDYFVYGFGLDEAGFNRNLTFIAYNED